VAISSASVMLAAWERGIAQGPARRGLALLALAEPDTEPKSLASLSVGQRDCRLLMLREAWFGPQMTGLMSCPACSTELEIELKTTDLRAIAAPEASAIAVRSDSHEIQLRLPDSSDLIAAADRSLADAAQFLLRACVVSAVVDGVEVEPEALSPHLVALCAERLSDADPLADLRLNLNCACCGCRWQAPFDIVPFLWTEFDAWAGRILREIDSLARAYGWSESEILSLSPARRKAYLRMVDA
jgi:hypothetical protein